MQLLFQIKTKEYKREKTNRNKHGRQKALEATAKALKRQTRTQTNPQRNDRILTNRNVPYFKF